MLGGAEAPERDAAREADRHARWFSLHFTRNFTSHCLQLRQRMQQQRDSSVYAAVGSEYLRGDCR